MQLARGCKLPKRHRNISCPNCQKSDTFAIGPYVKVLFPNFCPNCGARMMVKEKDATPVTNAGRIRSMSDEELAEWLTLKNTVPVECRIGSSKCGSCKRCWLDWLKSPLQEVPDA